MIKVKNVTKKFRDNVVLENINLTFESGKVYGVIGENGVGKTVFFKLISGFMAPTSGVVEVNDKVIGKDIDFPESCGIIIETPGFINNLSGYKNLKMLADIKGKIAEEEIKERMKSFGLNPNDKKKVKNYSLGMKQKLGLVQAFMEDPKILILDEPMNALDEDTVLGVRDLIKRIKQEKLIILASHNKEDIQLLCDEIYEVKNKGITRLECQINGIIRLSSLVKIDTCFSRHL